MFSKLQKNSKLQMSQVKLETLTGERIQADGDVMLGIDKLGTQKFVVMPSVAKNAIPRAVFVCQKRLYEFVHLPLGLTNAPS